jgi:hypothetical protein
MNDSKGDRALSDWIAPAAGVAFAILATAAFLLHRSGDFGTSQEFWTDFYGHRTEIQWQVFVYAVSGIPFITFFALVAHRLNKSTRDAGYFGAMIMAGAATTFVLHLLWATTRLTVTQVLHELADDDFIPVGLGLIIDLGNAASTLTGLAAAILVFAIGVAVIRSRALNLIYGFVSIALLALLLANGLLQVRWGGDWDTLGDATFFLFLLWTLVGAYCMAASPARSGTSSSVDEQVAAR